VLIGFRSCALTKEDSVADPATALSTVKGGIEVLDKLGILERLRLKLFNDPDQAARYLSVALSELVGGYTALHNEIVAFGLLDVDEGPGHTVMDKLTRLRDGRLGGELSSVKGSCARIGNIKTRYLNGWLNRIFINNPREQNEIEQVFNDLATVDGAFVKAAETLSGFAAQFAEEVLSLLRSNKTDEANARLKEIEIAFDPLRQDLSTKMTELWNLQAKFIELAHSI
jgi:hypothetical protein